MYDLVYEEMVKSGVAAYTNEPLYFDRDGNELSSDKADEVFGLPTNIKLVHPNYLLFVDEVGSNTDMKKDKQQGKQRVIAEKGCQGTRSAITSDLHYTVMGFTAATGEPVMCCVIFQSNNEESIPSSWVSGIDITKLGEVTRNFDAEKPDLQFLKDNKGKDKI
jgi:hypothetical protein